ncbi:hypothetical protein Syun_027146 [Stephania yunnanensis]|uniref:Receptor-like serine/threonine-protein kinase n=1 Tax=Stephania yunnanensis TaxID=152371 RepID=A0AAP0HR16_9MAGN
MASFIALILLCSSILYRLCFASDSITHNEYLRDGDTLVSNGGIYALGFFSPGKSQKRYIGVWYNQIPEQTVVWVANRDNPIHDSSQGIVKIVERGNLAIFSGSSSNPVWSTNVSIPNSKKINSSSLFYKLLDTGNLVLCDENKGEFLWQSFDFPTDTHLPGMKIGWNLKSGTSWSMTSWKSYDDPSTGDYTFGMSRIGSQELVIKKGSQKIWRSGAWNGQSWNGVPGFKPNSIVTFNVVKNQDEMYSIYSFSNTSILSMIVLDYLGVAQRKTWVQSKGEWNTPKYYPDDNCDNYGKCGVFGSCHTNYDPICMCLPGFEVTSPSESNVLEGSHTCVRKRKHLCGKGDGFIKLESIKLPDTTNSRIYMGLDMKECEIECRNNCSCTGYASAYVNERGCLAWFGDLMDIREYAEGGEDFFVRVDASELAKASRDSKESFTKKKLVLLCVLIAVGLLIFISTFYYFLKKARKKGSVQRERHPKQVLNSALLETNEETNTKFELPIFDLNSIMTATETFSLANKLGTGGFGSVYKGKLPDGREVAVKRLSRNSGQGVTEFKNEVVLIVKLQHRNLVQILGCCIEQEEKMLVYEYMPNRSLDFFLFDQSRSVLLNWRLRRDIILGIARGVLYLHQDSRLRIVHRDLKASNILLDASMNPKISDFGMARIFGGEQTQGNTNRVVGTFGYMPPEYVMHGLFSIKSDVFSFGVLLLEIISGKKNTSFYNEDPTMNLIKHAWELWRDGRPLELVDPSMDNSFPEQEVLKFIQVGILSVQENANDRPTMSSAIFMLENETTIPSLRQPAFVLTSNPNSPSPSGIGSDHSMNQMSTTIVEAR